VTRLLPALLMLCASLLLVHTAHAEEETRWTPDDVSAAIVQYAAEIGVSEAYLYAVVSCEDPSFNPYAVGRQGELGPVQLHPRGRLQHFLSLGYTDPYSPYQAVRYLAQEISFGRASAWSCA
jgi:hypothetical protein